jgi:RimJ/RimL family protein N-acetyltransferase
VLTSGRFTRIEPVAEAVVPSIARIALDAAASGQWRLADTSGGDQALGRVLGAGVVRQRLVVGRESNEVLGLCQLINADWRARRAELTVLLARDCWNRAWPMEGLALFIQDCFEELPLRKLFAQVTPEVFATIRSGQGRYFDVEGVLRERTYARGSYVDVTLLSIWRSAWPFERVGRFAARTGSGVEAVG